MSNLYDSGRKAFEDALRREGVLKEPVITPHKEGTYAVSMTVYDGDKQQEIHIREPNGNDDVDRHPFLVATRNAIHRQWLDLKNTVERVTFVTTFSVGSLPRTQRVFSLTADTGLVVQPRPGSIHLVHKGSGLNGGPAQSLAYLTWRKPRLVIRVLRRMEAANLWLTRVLKACEREWESTLRASKKQVEEVLAVATEGMLRNK